MQLQRTSRLPIQPSLWLAALFLVAATTAEAGTCPPLAQLNNHLGGGSVACPCFVPGEEFGAVFAAPAADYPIEILKVGIGWGSFSPSGTQTLEQAIHIYDDDLPNPGTPIFTLPGPLMTEGVINDFDLEPIPGEIIVADSFTVTLEFANLTENQIFAPTAIHDGSMNCKPGANVILANPEGWLDACGIGLTGNWVVYVIYRACAGAVGVGEPQIAASQPVMLMPARPNPFTAGTSLEFFLAQDGHASLDVYDVTGRRVANLVDRDLSAGSHAARWNGRGEYGEWLPSGTYFAELTSGEHKAVRKVFLTN